MDAQSANNQGNTFSQEGLRRRGDSVGDKVLIYTDATSNRLTYIFDFIVGELLGLEYELTNDRDVFAQSEDAKFTYAANPVGDEVFYEADPFLYQTDIHPQPINFCEYGDINGFYPVSPRSVIPFDMFASAFFMITRYEEYLPGKKDKYDRYRGKESMNFKGGFLERPMIDLYAVHLKNALAQKYPKLAMRQRRFEYIPTFDIDMAYSYLYKSARTNLGGFARSILTSDFAEFKDRMLVLMRRRKDPFDSFDYIFDICDKYSLKPRFFFLVGDKSRFDKNISFDNEPFRQLIKHISDKAEVGIHLSFKSHTSNERMSSEITRLEEITGNKAEANRFHYLRFQIPPSYVRLIKIGIKEDHSMGYAGRVGFRAATCSPFSFFNLKHNIKTDLRIYPFAFMDSTFTHYLKQDTDIALEKILQLMKSVRKVGGPFIGLWHNSSFSEQKEWRGWREVFETVAGEAAVFMNQNKGGYTPVNKA